MRLRGWVMVMVMVMVSSCYRVPHVACSKVSLGVDVDSIHTVETSPPWFNRHTDLTLKGPVVETECCAQRSPSEACLAVRERTDCSQFDGVRFVMLVDYTYSNLADPDDAFFCKAAVLDGKLITVHGYIEDN